MRGYVEETRGEGSRRRAAADIPVIARGKAFFDEKVFDRRESGCVSEVPVHQACCDVSPNINHPL